MPQDEGFEATALHVEIDQSGSTDDAVDKPDTFHVAIVDVGMSGSGSTEEFIGIEQNYLCGFCDRLYQSKTELVSHVCFKKKNLNIVYECRECNNFYESLDTLAGHIKEHKQKVILVRNESQPLNPLLSKFGYRCSLCDKFLCSKGSLVKHQQLHMGLKPFCCSFCGKSFSLKGNRDKHELIHAGERPHKCDVCDKSFTLKGNLQQHVLTHTNYKKFKCHLCGNEFTLKGNLNKHIKRHQNGMKPTLKRKYQGEPKVAYGDSSAKNSGDSSAKNHGDSSAKNHGDSSVDDNVYGVKDDDVYGVKDDNVYGVKDENVFGVKDEHVKKVSDTTNQEGNRDAPSECCNTLEIEIHNC